MASTRPSGQRRDTRDLGALQGAPRILVAASGAIRERILVSLRRLAHIEKAVGSHDRALAEREEWPAHLIIVDADLDGPDTGLAVVARRLRSGRRLPAIVIADHNAGVALRAFAAGADDFVSYPFAHDELQARIQAVLRRAYGDRAPLVPALSVGPLEIDLIRQRYHLNGTALKLSPTERTILYLLVANAGKVVSRNTILDTLWGEDYRPGSNVIDRHVVNLRTKLRDDPKDPQLLRTVRGEGYIFRA